MTDGLTMFNVKPTSAGGFAAWVAAHNEQDAADLAVNIGVAPGRDDVAVEDLSRWVASRPAAERRSIATCLTAGVPGRMHKTFTDRLTLGGAVERAAAGGPPRTGPRDGTWSVAPTRPPAAQR